MAGTKKQRNSEIDIYRMIMAILVMIYHLSYSQGETPLVKGAYLAVEFFFILSGYYGTQKAIKSEMASCREAFLWTVHKWSALLIYTIPIVLGHWLLYGAFFKLDRGKWAHDLIYSIYDMLLMLTPGFAQNPSYTLLGPLWYISAFLLVLPLFYIALLRVRQAFLYLICPLSCIMVYGYFSITVGHICTAHMWLGLFKSDIPRAWAGLCMGSMVWLLQQFLCSLPPLSRTGKLALTVAKYGLMFIVLTYIFRHGFTTLDFLCIALMAVWVAIAFSQKTYDTVFFQNCPIWVGSFCAEFSKVLYLCHGTIRWVIMGVCFLDMPYLERMQIYVPISLLYALTWMLIINGIKKLHLGAKLKRIIFI